MLLVEDPDASVPTPTGSMRTFMYRPVAPGRYPGVLLFSEIFQRTGPIKRTAALMAGHGFVVAVPEIFHEHEPAGTVLGYDKPGTDRGNALKLEKPVSGHDSDARALLEIDRLSPLPWDR